MKKRPYEIGSDDRAPNAASAPAARTPRNPDPGSPPLDDDPDSTLVLDERPAWAPTVVELESDTIKGGAPAHDTISEAAVTIPDQPPRSEAPTLLNCPAPGGEAALTPDGRPVMVLERGRVIKRAPRGADAGGRGGADVNTVASPRTTVLPTIASRGREPELVYDGRARYEQLGLLGQGGMGSVFKAQDNDIGRAVAVKTLHPHLRSRQGMVQFTEEVRTIGRLEHPNIVPIHDVGVDDDGGHYFVMKYVAGETLESVIDKLNEGNPEYHRHYTFERRVEIFVAILEAMHYAHSQGTIHRDIKPANIMVGSYGEVVVMDWGLAQSVRTADAADGAPKGEAVATAVLPESVQPETESGFERTAQAGIMGTPAYMSPEQARGEAVDERSDTYSLCVLLWELLCLRHYLRDRKSVVDVLAAVITEPVPAATTRRHAHQPPVPADLSWFLVKGLAKNRDERFQSVTEMLERLRLRADGIVPIQCPLTFAHRTTRGLLRVIDRHPMAYVATLAGAAISVVALGIYAIL